MRALYIERFGGPDVLTLAERPKPVPRHGEVLIRVVAAAVNPRDWLLQEGRYPFQRALGRFPIILGSDFSGIVEALGQGVTKFKRGDAVFGMSSRMGAFAEWVSASTTTIAMKPAQISHIEAAAIPCSGLTAYQALVTIGRLQPGDAVLINGASGGVGSYAIQIAKVLGAKLTAVASGSNAEMCRRLGADAALDYASTDFIQVARNQDIVFDAVGRSNFPACKPVLKSDGRYITTVPNRASLWAVQKTGLFSLGGFLKRQRAHLVLVQARGADLEAMSAWIDQGRLRSVIAGSYPLADAATAFAKSKSWHTAGKLVLEVSMPP